MFTKFLDNLKTQQKVGFTDTAIKPLPSGSVDDSAINAPTMANQPKRRWSYVTYLNEGTLHGDGDNLMIGL